MKGKYLRRFGVFVLAVLLLPSAGILLASTTVEASVAAVSSSCVRSSGRSARGAGVIADTIRTSITTAVTTTTSSMIRTRLITRASKMVRRRVEATPKMIAPTIRRGLTIIRKPASEISEKFIDQVFCEAMRTDSDHN